MMFYGAKIRDNCFYFIKTISENESLVKFIDEMNDDSRSYSMLPKWENINNNLKKNIYKNNVVDDVRTYQKCLYIINSIDSGIRYCLSLFCENSNFKHFNVKNIELYKTASSKILNESIDSSSNESYSAYMFINNKPGDIKITFNDNGQSLNVDEASIFIVSNKENITIQHNLNKELYFAKANFNFIGEK